MKGKALRNVSWVVSKAKNRPRMLTILKKRLKRLIRSKKTYFQHIQMLRKEGTHLFWAGNGGIDRGNNFCVCCSASSPASPFSDVCCGTDTWGHCQRWGPGRVCAPLGRAGNGDGRKKFLCFLKKFFTICHQGHTIFGLPNLLFRYPHQAWLRVTK